MALPPATSGYAFVGPSNLHTDIYPSISPRLNPSLHQPGKIILITGAARGIGRAIALQYAYAGVGAVVLCDLPNSPLDEVEASIKEINKEVRVHKHTLDVSSETAVADLSKAITAAESRIDILINNAAHMAPWVPLHQSDPTQWWRTLEVNLKGPYLLAHAFLPLLMQTAKQTGHVDVINVVSMGALMVSKVASMYAISKLAVCRLSEHLDGSYKEEGVCVVNVNPGGVLTDMARQEEEILGPSELCLFSGLWGASADVHVVLNDSPDLCGGFAVWLTAQQRKWLGGRYVSATWDVDVLESMKDEIVAEDKLKVKLVV